MNERQKEAFIKATHRHAQQDMLRRGHYGNGGDGGEFKACSIGCLANDIADVDDEEKHALVAKYYGYPEWLVHLQDSLFEYASEGIHTAMAYAIKPREDWQSVLHAISRRILEEISLPYAGSSTAAVQVVIDLHKTETPAESPAWAAASEYALQLAERATNDMAKQAAKSAALSAAWHQKKFELLTAWLGVNELIWQQIMKIVLEEISK